MIKTILGYDIEPGVSAEEYENWLFNVHVPDIMANPYVQRLSFNKVLRPVSSTSDGSPIVSEGMTFYRVAEMEFADETAYRKYLDWFLDHQIPKERGPNGRTAFRFYLVTESTVVERGQDLPPSFLDVDPRNLR